MRSLRPVWAAGVLFGLLLAGPLPAGEAAKDKEDGGKDGGKDGEKDGGKDGLVFYGEADAKASSMTSDKPETPKAIRPHDLVTVKIKDVYSFLNNTTLNTSSKSETELAIDSFFKITSGKGGRGWDLTPSASDKPKIEVSGERKQDNTGRTAQKQAIEAMITGHVLEVYPNHTFSFEATQAVEQDENTMTMTLFGIARVEDISPDNVVLGERLDSKQFSVKNDGPVARMGKRGWLTKILDLVWPF
jgi:flagellar L-ring protein precursor FlgH